MTPILVVDDDDTNLAALRAVLETLELQIVEARSGREALEQLTRTDFAVILIAIVMPGLEGFDTARLIRKFNPSAHTSIIFLAAQEIDQASLEQAYLLGAVDVVVRPLRPVILQAKIRGLVELFSEKKRAQQEAEQLRLLVHGTSDYAIFMLDPGGHVVTWNSGAERLKGYEASEIIGSHFSRFYPPEALNKGWPDYELKVASTEGRFEDEGWRLRKDGSRFWANVVITALFNERGELRGFSKITRDLTDRKIAEENARQLIRETTARQVAEENAALIREQRERLHVTLTSIGDAVITTDAEGRVEFLNKVAESLVGWKTAEAMNHLLPEIFNIINEHSRLPVENPAMRALREGRIVGLANHTILIARDGTEYPIDDSAAPIRDSQGGVIGTVLVFRDISEKKQHQEALRESEGRFRGLMEQAPFSIQVFSLDGRTVDVNQAWKELWGVSPEQIADYNILNDAQLEAKGVLKYIRRAFAGEAVSVPAIQYAPNEMLPGQIRQAGPERWVSAVAYPLKDDRGNVREVILVHEDITARRRTDMALRDSEERLRLALEAGHMGVWDWNVRTGDINWSDTLEPLHGLAPGTFAGTFEAFQELIHPDDRAMVTEAIQHAVQQGTAYDVEFRNIWPNGSMHWISGKGLVFAGSDGQPERMVGIGMDVTQRRRSEHTARFLAEASATLSVLVDFNSTLQKVASLAVPYFADWATVDLVEANGALKRVAVAHVDPTKIALANDLHERFPPDATASHGVWHVVRSGKSEIISELTDEILEGVITDPELLQILKQVGITSYIGVPLKLRGKTIGALTFVSAESGHHYDEIDLAVAEDLADRSAIAIENTRLYRELREADQRKDEFLATLAHELRNPLAPIRTSLQILKMPRVDHDMGLRTRDMMERQVQHLVRLVDDLLDVSRVMRGKIELRKERVELATIIARAVETAKPLIDSRGHHLHVSLPDTSLPLFADPIRLAQVVGNLLTNSAKYTEPNGHIQITGTQAGNELVVSVQDDGIGIAPDMLPHIFELFVQADHASTNAMGGLGIGLTLVKNLVEMHEGKVEAYSEGLGKGAAFVVTLPLLVEDQNTTEEPSPVLVEPDLSGGHRLLVVDDNQDAAASLALLLRLQGHEVQVANDGATALEIASLFKPELIFLDIGMPGLDGYEVARRIRRTPGLDGTVLAALTGWGQQEDRRRSAEAGFDHHLVKPPDPQAIEDLVMSLPRTT